jgi:hypothetical protein
METKIIAPFHQMLVKKIHVNPTVISTFCLCSKYFRIIFIPIIHDMITTINVDAPYTISHSFNISNPIISSFFVRNSIIFFNLYKIRLVNLRFCGNHYI